MISLLRIPPCCDRRWKITTAYRETALNLNDPHISEGERITKEMFVRMQAAVLTKGVRLIVLLIPTKESVYADVMRGNGLSVGTYARLVGWETQARSDILNWCSEKRISCVDALPALQKAVAVGQRIYPSSTESHPNAAGYAILAATVENALK